MQTDITLMAIHRIQSLAAGQLISRWCCGVIPAISKHRWRKKSSPAIGARWILSHFVESVFVFMIQFVKSRCRIIAVAFFWNYQNARNNLTHIWFYYTKRKLWWLIQCLWSNFADEAWTQTHSCNATNLCKWNKKQKRHNDAEPVHANDLSASKFVKNYKIFCTIINFDTYRIIFRSFLLDQKTKTITKINKHEKLWLNTVYSAPP